MKTQRRKTLNSEHSKRFNDIKAWYEAGIWKKKAVKNAVVKGWITTSEYEEITGEPYEA